MVDLTAVNVSDTLKIGGEEIQVQSSMMEAFMVEKGGGIIKEEELG